MFHTHLWMSVYMCASLSVSVCLLWFWSDLVCLDGWMDACMHCVFACVCVHVRMYI